MLGAGMHSTEAALRPSAQEEHGRTHDHHDQCCLEWRKISKAKQDMTAAWAKAEQPSRKQDQVRQSLDVCPTESAAGLPMEVKAEEDSERPLIKLLFICELFEVFFFSLNIQLLHDSQAARLAPCLQDRTGCRDTRSSEGLDTKHGCP